jgi:hypothetical protein
VKGSPHRYGGTLGRVVALVSVAVAAVATLPGRSMAAPSAPVPPVFGTPGLYDANGPSIQAFSVADFNGDGANDVAVANLNGSLPNHGLSVLLGDGAGKLGTPVVTPYPGGNESALDVSAADFNGDGRVDLVTPTIDGTGYQLRILLGAGDGTFTMGAVIPAANDRAVAADVNADGKADVVFVVNDGKGSNIHVALGQGNGTFAPATVYPPPFYIKLADIALRDVNADTRLDLVYLEGCPTVRLGNGDGTFGAEICSTDPQARLSGVTMALADFNMDGKQDMAVGDASGGHVTIALGDGAGRFTFFKQYAGIAYQVISIAAADFTGDGRADIVASADPNWQGTESSFTLLKGKGTGVFTGFEQFVSGGFGFVPAEMNGDQWIDLVSTDLISTGDAFLTINGGKGSFNAPRVFHTVANASVVRAGDLNGDGKQDVLVPASGNLYAHLNLGRSNFGPAKATVVQGGIYAVVLADVNLDGKLDAIGGTPGTKNVRVMFGLGTGTFAAPVGYAAGGTASVVSVAVADVTGDGKLDIVAHTSTQLAVLPGNGDGTFAAAKRSGTSGGGSQKATLVEDFDGDGTRDAVVVKMTGTTNFASSVVYRHHGNGDGTFTLVQTVNVDTNASSARAADLNGDGRPEVALVGWKGSDGGRTGLFVYPNATGTLGAAAYHPSASTDLALADFNVDGSLDVVATCVHDPCASLATALVSYANNGDGTFAGPYAINTIYAPYGLAAADFGGDGRPDFVEAVPGATDSKFVVYTNVKP